MRSCLHHLVHMNADDFMVNRTFRPRRATKRTLPLRASSKLAFTSMRSYLVTTSVWADTSAAVSACWSGLATRLALCTIVLEAIFPAPFLPVVCA